MADGCTWVPYNRSLHESSLVCAATDSDGGSVVIARAHLAGDLIPGKGLPRHHKCHVSHNGKEHPTENFEVLMNTGGFSWQSASNGHVPVNAVVGGRTSTGETLYVGRAKHAGLIIPGKVHQSHKCLYFPCDWKEHSKTTYEVLVKQPSTGWTPGPPIPIPPVGGGSLQWVHWSRGRPWPHNAVPAGVYREGGQRNVQYIARRNHNASVILGYAYVNGPFYTSWHGTELSFQDFELLVETVSCFPRDGF